MIDFEKTILYFGLRPHMMPCDQDVSRKRFQRSPSLENLDEFSIEHQQQTLLDLSLGKLHQEQAQQIEPCLLKSVLISNAVRALQHHMISTSLSPSDDLISEEKEEDSMATNFIVNTFNSSDYCLTPSSPILPQKFPKLDASFGCSPLALTQQATESTDESFVHPLLPIVDQTHEILKSDVHPFFSHNYNDDASTSLLTESSTKNQAPKVLLINGNVPTVEGAEGHCKTSSNSELDVTKCGSETDSNFECMDTSLSPLDLKGIDPLLYDFDARSPPMLPSPSETKQVGHFSSCSAEATNINANIDNTGIKDMENDPSVLLDEIVNMLIET